MELHLDTTAKVVSLTIGLTTIVTSIIYLIIWLVQLNVGFVANTTMIEKVQKTIAEQEQAHIKISNSLERTGIILTQLEKRTAKLEEYIEHDDDEVDEIRNRVNLNERDIKNHFENHDWSFE